MMTGIMAILAIFVLIGSLYLAIIKIDGIIKPSPRIVKLYHNLDIELTHDSLIPILNNLAERIQKLEREKL